jgi:DNA-binding response OmpR family regulator
MKVLSFLCRCDRQRRIERALSSAQFVVETVVSAKECLQFTRFAQYQGVLVDSDSLIFEDTLVLLRFLRQENSDAALFFFAHYLDLEQRLRLFEAGADDCVREPFFASELAVRLGLSIRLRQGGLRSCWLQYGLVCCAPAISNWIWSGGEPRGWERSSVCGGRNSCGFNTWCATQIARLREP